MPDVTQAELDLIVIAQSDLSKRISALTIPASPPPPPPPPPPSGIPAAANAVGYTSRVFGPSMTLNTNWFKWTTNVNATQNADGSITTTGGGNTWGQNLITARPTSGANWSGAAWTGGAYFEWTMSFTGPANPSSIANGWPSLWLVDMEGPGFTDGSAARWQGQASNYYRWATINVAEWANNHTPMANGNTIYHEFSDFYAVPGSNTQVETGYNANGSPYVTPAGFDFSKPHKYGFLWVPATSSTRGYAQYFVDDVRVDTGVATWNQYNPATAPPPVKGTTAFSFIDSRHIAALFGTGPQNPLTVSAFSVWQKSATAPPPPPPPPPPPTGGPGTGPAFKLPAGNRTVVGGQRVSVNMDITDNQPGYNGRLTHGIKPYFYMGVWRNAEAGLGFFSGGTTVGWIDQGVYLYDDDIARIFSANGLPPTWPANYPVNGSRLGIRWWTYGTAGNGGVDLQLYAEPGMENVPQYDVINDYKGPSRGDTFGVTPNVFGAGRCVQTSWGSYYDLTQDSRGPAGYGRGWIAFNGYNMTMDQIRQVGF